jgi:mannose-1-phosphate guanylyltransferase
VKAVVLVGGEGTRLRPLTETIPKPLIPVMDRRFLDIVLDHLARHGVTEAILSSPYLERTFHPFIAARGDSAPAITWLTESSPLGTGGAVVNALDHLAAADAVFALNGDILTDLDLTAMLAFHRERRASVTIALTHVDDARPFGLVPTDDDGRVSEFLEKPAEPLAGDVNAGTYVLDPAVLHGFARGEPSSIERDLFPAIIADGRPVYGFLSHGYWMDLGTPEKYLQAHADILGRKVEGLRYAAPWIATSATIDPAAVLGPEVVVGEGAAVGSGATLERSVIHPGAEVGEGAEVRDSIVGARAVVGAGASVVRSVLGEGSTVAPGARLEDARVPSRAPGA